MLSVLKRIPLCVVSQSKSISCSSVQNFAAAAQPKSNLAKLRKKTGYSLSLCKKALEGNDNDVGKAEQWLKDQALSQGWAKANKLEGRNTTQGLVGLLIKDNAAAMIELNCETDFVARNEQFHELLNEISQVALNHAKQIETSSSSEVTTKSISKEEMGSWKSLNQPSSLADLVALNIGQIGEKLDLKRGVLCTCGQHLKLAGVTHPSANIHRTHMVQYGRYGTIMAYVMDKENGILPEGQNEVSMGRQLCQHIIGMNPSKIGDLSSMTPFEFDKLQEDDEKQQIASQEAKTQSEEGAEEMEEDEERKNALRQTVDHEELINQEFLLDSSLKVGHVLLQTGISVKDFVRYEVGQGAN